MNPSLPSLAPWCAAVLILISSWLGCSSHPIETPDGTPPVSTGHPGPGHPGPGHPGPGHPGTPGTGGDPAPDPGTGGSCDAQQEGDFCPLEAPFNCASNQDWPAQCVDGAWVCSPPACPGCGAPEEPPADVPSRAQVRFNFAASQAAGYLVVGGLGCAPFTVEHVLDDGSTEMVRSGVTQNDDCSGSPPPQDFGTTSLVDLSAPRTAALTWDGRAVQAYSTCVDCSQGGTTGGGLIDQLAAGGSAPVDPGTYRARFAVLATPDQVGCQLGADGTASCTPPYVGPTDGRYDLPPCPGGGRYLTVDFTLPADGQVDVDVPTP
jgi:hypothetical protein